MEKLYYDDGPSLFVEIKPISVSETNGSRKEEHGYISTGVILFCQPQFALVIAHNACLNDKYTPNPTGVMVSFPDKTRVLVAIENIKRSDHFIFIDCVPKSCIDTKVVKAVEFCEEKLTSKGSVHTLQLRDFEATADLTSGVVGRVEDSFFYHSCRAGNYGKTGSPVFNDKAQFVGLCYEAPCGILAASTVLSIAKNLSWVYGIARTGIKEMLQQIYIRNMPKDGQGTG